MGKPDLSALDTEWRTRGYRVCQTAWGIRPGRTLRGWIKSIMDYIVERRIGTRRIIGTDHPVVAVAYKVNSHCWVATVLVNGIAQGGTTYATKREAVAVAEGQEYSPDEPV